MAKATKKKATKKAAPKKATTKKAAPATKKAAAPKKVTTKKAAPATKKVATKRKPNPAFMKALTPSSALAAVVGGAPMPRTQAVKKIWDYIKKHNLQDAKNRRNINADEKLRVLFGKATVSMFELSSILNKHLK